jgi:hypothetical protein
MMTPDLSQDRPLLSCEGARRPSRIRKHQVCDRCGGRFGLVMHRWWGNKFCKRTCKDAYLREVALDRDTIRRRLALRVSRAGYKPFSVPLYAFDDR